MDEAELSRRADYYAEDDDEDFLSNPRPYKYVPLSPPAVAEHFPADVLSPSTLTEAEAVQLGKEAIRNFLATRTTYDAMPKSARVVVFDVNINLKLVLNALLEHEIRGAPLWSPGVQQMVGVITLSDFGDILSHAMKTGESAKAILESHTITTWRLLMEKSGGSGDEIGQRTAASLRADLIKRYRNPPGLTSVEPYDTLLDACIAMRDRNIHRMPVIDSSAQTCLHIITHQSVIDYLTAQFAEERRLFDQSIFRLRVGQYLTIDNSSMGLTPDSNSLTDRPIVAPKVAYLDTPLSDVITWLQEDANCSIVPVIDRETRKVRELYRRSHIACLLNSGPKTIQQATATTEQEIEREEEENLPALFSLRMNEVLERLEASNPEMLEPIRTCSPESTMYQVLVKLAESKVRTLVIVDEKGGFLGLCSLSDVLAHFL